MKRKKFENPADTNQFAYLRRTKTKNKQRKSIIEVVERLNDTH
jgi:hypothetical protein